MSIRKEGNCPTHGDFTAQTSPHGQPRCPMCKEKGFEEAHRKLRKKLLGDLILAFQENPELAKDFWTYPVAKAFADSIANHPSILRPLNKALNGR